jgi:hypothetical protein
LKRSLNPLVQIERLTGSWQLLKPTAQAGHSGRSGAAFSFSFAPRTSRAAKWKNLSSIDRASQAHKSRFGCSPSHCALLCKNKNGAKKSSSHLPQPQQFNVT